MAQLWYSARSCSVRRPSLARSAKKFIRAVASGAGMNPRVDSYSGFFDNGRRGATGLTEWLRAQGVSTISVCGLATDYCVRFTVLDALREGFQVTLLTIACRGVNLTAGGVDRAVAEMQSAGAVIS